MLYTVIKLIKYSIHIEKNSIRLTHAGEKCIVRKLRKNIESCV